MDGLVSFYHEVAKVILEAEAGFHLTIGPLFQPFPDRACYKWDFRPKCQKRDMAKRLSSSQGDNAPLGARLR